jgi:hypothetical protein
MYFQLLEVPQRKMRLSRFVLVTCFLGIVAAGALAVQSTRTITVESEGRREYRRIENDGYVRLVRRLSDAPCIQGRSWGYDRNGIWVDDGCRAIFEVRNRYDDRDRRDDRYDDRDRRRDDWRRNDGLLSGRGTIRLESHDGRMQSKSVNTRGGVRLIRTLSDRPCVYNRSWGYSANRIWVDNGCRAVFEVGYGNGNGYGYGRPNDRRYPDWLPGRYRGYEDGREFALEIGLDGRVSLRRNYGDRWSDYEYGYCEDDHIRVGNFDYNFSRSGNTIRLQSRNSRDRAINLKRL